MFFSPVIRAFAAICLLMVYLAAPGLVSGIALSGRVTTAGGVGVAGVAITVVQVGGELLPLKATTGEDGRFLLSDGLLFGNVRVTAAKAEFSIAPSTRDYFSSADIRDADFTATPIAPLLARVLAVNVGSSGLTLTGFVNPQRRDTLVWFEWGSTTNYGQETVRTAIANVGIDQSHLARLTGLPVGMTLHFRMVAENSLVRVHSPDASVTLPRFVEQTPLVPPFFLTLTLGFGSAAVIDVDTNGTLDFVITPAAGEVFPVVLNGLDGSHQLDSRFGGDPRSTSGAMDWHDADHDGIPDKLVTYGFEDPNNQSLLRGPFQNFIGGLTRHANFRPSQLEWLDADNDGQSEILSVSQAFIGGFTRQVFLDRLNLEPYQPLLPSEPSDWCSIATGDADGDGRRDLLCVLGGTVSGAFLKRNRPAGFLSETLSGEGALAYAAWADWDQDGREDMIITRTGGLPMLYRNTGSGFSVVPTAIRAPALQPFWGDFNNDGRLDLLFYGFDAPAALWYNTPTGFVQEPMALPTILAAGDFDGDGRLDLFRSTGFEQCALMRNETGSPANTPPSPPTQLEVRFAGPEVVLSWDAGIDAQTPSTTLAYNVCAGTTPGGIDVLAPLSLADGRRLKPDFGNARWSHRLPLRTTALVGKTLFWSVQSIDSSFAGSAFSREMSVVIPPGDPTLVPGDTDGDWEISQAELEAVLARYKPKIPPQVERLLGPSGSLFDVSLGNFGVLQPTAEGSFDLKTWEPLGPAQLFYRISDPAGVGASQRFYRLNW